MAIYKWANDWNVMTGNSGVCLNKKLDAGVVGKEMERLEKKHDGKITAEQLEIEGRSKKCKYHGALEWDDTKAGRKYRIEQCKLMVRSLKIVYEVTDEEEPREIRALTSVLDPDNGKGRRVYIPTEEGLKHKDTRDEILMQCLQGLVRWRKKWSEYNELAEVLPIVEEAEKTLRKKIGISG